MKITEQTKRILAYRRTVKRWREEGYEEVGEGGGRLWEIYRGGRVGHRITDARIAPNGLSVFVKIEAP